MTVETKPRFRWPCWLIGHRPKVDLLAPVALYDEHCQNCPKRRLFQIKNDGRHNIGGWKVPTTS